MVARTVRWFLEIARARRSFRRCILPTCAAAILVAAPTPARAAFPGTNGRIAFGRVGATHANIFTIEPEGTSLTKLTRGIPGGWFESSWSADGSKIAIVGYPGRHTALIVADADGSNPVTLTNEIGRTGFNFSSPTWSPDGSQIAFCVSNGDLSKTRIFVIAVDGTALTRISPPDSRDCDPAWSPDGTKIAFDTVLGRHGQRSEIWTMAPDGSDRVVLVADGYNTSPDWSPDGGTIVYSANEDLYVVPASGGAATQLTDTRRAEFEPVFSPDGTNLAFTVVRFSPRRQHSSIWTMALDGTSVIRLTDVSSKSFTGRADWQPLTA
jgi:Tol biopolymer transport system component